MPYIVNFTDKQNKVPVTVYDNSTSTDTSLRFPGRNVTGYGQIIAENFLALLENFAAEADPVNPVEGQLWYDTTSSSLQLWDGSNWKAASTIQRSVTDPAVLESKVGELWVDTVNQQLYIFSGKRWILVGPTFSSGVRSGPLVETVLDSDSRNQIILTFYVEDLPVIIFSKNTFTPKQTIVGFPVIRTGINITEEKVDVTQALPKLYGTAKNADALNILDTEVPASRFLRSDVVNTVEFGINIRNNQGLTLGVDGTFSLSTSTTASKIYNSAIGSSIDLQINREGTPTTVLRIFDNRVGINKLVPDEALDIEGNIGLSGSLIVTNVAESTNLNNGSIRTAGGISVTKNALIGQDINVLGTSILKNTIPATSEAFDIGTTERRWGTVRAKALVADTIEGTLKGDIEGNATTATNLRFITSFSLAGDVTSQVLDFDGQSGGSSKIFNTSLTSAIISSKNEPFPNVSTPNDFILIFRPGSGLLKERRNIFVGDLAVPIGAIMPFAGTNVPYGYLLCDGSEIERSKYSDLYDVIGTIYGVTALGVNTFKLPDLRGRFALGRDNMDNTGVVPNTVGGYVDAGGGNVDRVPGTAADNLGGSGGSSSNTLTTSNLPNHEHTMRGSTGQQYYASRVDTAVPLDIGAFSDKGPTAIGQSQYLPNTGGVRTNGSLNQPFTLMNPYLTLNYIIRSGPPAF